MREFLLALTMAGLGLMPPCATAQSMVGANKSTLVDYIPQASTPTWTPGEINIFAMAALPGDVDASGEVSSSDVICVVNYLFKRLPLPTSECVADVNADSVAGLLDIVCLVNYIFREGTAPLDGCQEPLADYWPLSKGNYWIYQCDSDHSWCSGGPFYRFEVAEQSADTAMVIRTMIRSGWADTLILREQDQVVEWRRPGGSWELFYRFEDSTTWLHRDPFECNDSLLNSTTLEAEPIVTPAGTFAECLRIAPHWLQYRCADAGTRREWWAPGVGLVSWYEDNIAGEVHFVLTDYRIESQRLPDTSPAP